MRNYIAFFDLDNTILDTNSGKYLVKHAFREGILSRKDLAKAYYLSIIYKLGIIEPTYIIDKMALWLKGVPERHIVELSEKVFEISLKPSIREAARSEIAFHKERNGDTVLLSAANHYICTLIQDYMELDDMICTEMEVVDGHFTGLPKGSYCYGAEKLNRLKAYCRAKNCTAEQAYYYADAWSDLPVLEAVGRPVCVTPEPKLHKVALKRGWPVYNW